MRTNNKFGTTMVLMAILLVSLAVIPAASASSDKEVTSVPTVGTSTIESLKTAGILSTSTITQGQTKSYSTTITNPDRHYFRAVLNWIPTSDSLRLTITSPTGQVYGPYYDATLDGSNNGYIEKIIQAPAGLATGTWTSRVYGQSVASSAQYSYGIYIS